MRGCLHVCGDGEIGTDRLWEGTSRNYAARELTSGDVRTGQSDYGEGRIFIVAIYVRHGRNGTWKSRIDLIYHEYHGVYSQIGV